MREMMAGRKRGGHNGSMRERIGWTRDQQLVALRLYMRVPFGRLHGRNPEIIALAERMGRTANAVAMKACNSASLDPAFRKSNRKGLSRGAGGCTDREEFAGTGEAGDGDSRSGAELVA